MTRATVAACAIVLAAMGLAGAAAYESSATTDEPIHVLAAWSHVVEGKSDLNSDKPPLSKLLAGAALATLGLRGTEHDPVTRLSFLPDETRRFLYRNTARAETILRLARLPQILFLAALLAGVFVFARRLWGDAGALLALVAVASQPLVLGHAPLVHTDVPAAATTTWALYALFRWLRGARGAWIAFGVLLGLALLAKFSAVLIVPIGILLLALETGKRGLLPRLLRYAAACVLAAAVVAAGYAPELRRTTPEEQGRTIAVIAAQWPETAGIARRLTALARVAPAFAHYGLGLLHVAETDRLGQGVNYLLGRTSREGSFLYFPIALLVKTTVPFLGLLVLTAVLKSRRWNADDAFLLVPCALLLLPALVSRYNIGARHLLPLVPLLAIWSGQVAPWLSRAARGALLAALAVPALLAFPHYISHFSLLAGGSRHGARVLNDSNLDWGQDWQRVGKAAASARWTPLSYVYIGTGFPGYHLPGAHDWIDAPVPPRAGFYAVSSFAESVGPPYLAYLGAPDRANAVARLLAILRAKGHVVARVGTSITVYELP